MSEHKHNWVETGKVRGGTAYKCEACGSVMSQGPGTIEPDKSFEQRVIETVVADLKANGKIRMAIVGVYDQENDARKS